MQEIWHYPRARDAQRLVATLDVGLVSAIAIIEPRRRGKTTFLQEDLAPLAVQHGYAPIYINLAATTGGLEALIVAAIGAALEARQRGLGARLRKLGQARLKKLTGKASLATGEVGGELEFDSGPSTKGPLAAAFRELLALKAPVLFLLDEVHRLADVRHHTVAWSLRSLLDTHRKTMKVVATSSSAASYDLMVSGEKKAFNRWFTRVALSPLDQDFVAHLARIIKTHFPKHAITPAHIAGAFEALGGSPKFTRDYLSQRIMNPQLDHATALREAEAQAAKDSGFDDEFERLPPLQKTLLVGIGSGVEALFSEAALTAFGKAPGEPPISKTLAQRALKSLSDKGWIIRQDWGDYKLADALFEQWLHLQIKRGVLSGPASGPTSGPKPARRHKS